MYAVSVMRDSEVRSWKLLSFIFIIGKWAWPKADTNTTYNTVDSDHESWICSASEALHMALHKFDYYYHNNYLLLLL